MKHNLVAKLYNDYSHQVFGFALKHIKSEELAHDIVQDVFLVLCQKDLKKVKNIKSFIFQITSHKVADHFRKRVKDEKLQQDMWTYIAGKQLQHNDQLISKEYEIQFQKAMDELTPQQKIIFRMSREEGLSNKMIAEKLHLSKNTVKNHMVSALKTLKKNIILPSDNIVYIICLAFILGL
ncbi:sigma-70 family RNA polymerase sigma factor [Membranihabitans marinus]|uniref:sigma-70 family RNA polymerase sigma factor n=1 Tax=Membranihabitans marinus TaxID=1227546 RepID=UPI001F00961C|nr:sigma-70 family RNA polymerase sigma factor [Membranihabitans marinus]